MTKLYTNYLLRNSLILLFLIPPLVVFSRINGDPIHPDTLAKLRQDGHVECNIHVDTNCVSKNLTLEAWIDWTFTGVSEPVTVPWNTGVTAHKIIVTPPGAWSWDVTNIGCEPVHQNNFISYDKSFFGGQINIEGPPAICPFELVELTVNTQGYSDWSSFEWSPENDQLSPFTISAPGIYSITVTDAYGCPFTDQINIPLIPPFVPQITGPNKICPEGDTTILVVQGPYHNFQWSNGESGSPLTVTEPGNYEVTATDAFGCTGVGYYGVQSAGVDPFQITVTSTSLCPGQLDTLRVLGGFSHYDWSNGVHTLTNIVNQAGTYTVTVTNIDGCTGTATTVVTPLFPPNIQITSTPLCPGGVATLTTVGGIFPNYSWSTSQSGPSIAINNTGTYSVTVSGTGVCATSTNIVVNLAAVPNTVIANPGLLTCVALLDTLDGSGSSSGANYPFVWTTQGGNFFANQNTLNPVVNQPGMYILSITDATTGCVTLDTVQVLQNTTPPGANAGPPATLTCANQSLIIGPNPAPNNPAFSPSWSTGNGNISSGGNTWSPTVTLPGTYTLQVTNSVNQCTSTASVVIPQDIVPPLAQIAPPGIITCTQSTVPLIGSGSSSGPNFIYSWSTTNGTLQGGTTGANATAASIGTYTLTVTNTANGCQSSASVVVGADTNIPVVNALPPAILTCDLKTVTIDASGSSSGPEYQYSWTSSGAGTVVNGINTLTPEVNGPGVYTLLLVNTTNNCTATLGVVVNQDIQPPVADAGPTLTLNCTLASLQLDGSGSDTGPNFSYQWTTTNGQIQMGETTLNPTVLLAGTYTLQVTNSANGCTSTSEALVLNDANAPIAAIAPPAILTCATNLITINAGASTTVGNLTYLWTGPGIQSGQGTLQLGVNLPGTYTLLITNNVNGCTDDAGIVVDQDIVPPVAAAGPDVLINCYTPTGSLGSLTNPSGPGFTLSWTTVGGNFISPVNGPTATVNQPGNYQLLITNTQNGCTATDNVVVQSDFTPPTIDAGPTFELTCVVTSTILQASGSVGPNFTYKWTTTDGNIQGPNDVLQPVVNADGVYNLLITNTQNGCTSTDAVTITQAADVPTAVAGLPQTLTCTLTSTLLNGTGSSAGPEFSYLWSTANGHIFANPNSLTPTIDAPGTYVVTVTNNTNSCTSVASVTILQNIVNPVVDAGQPNTLTCAVTSLPLNAQIVSSSSPGISYTWGTTGGQILLGGNTASPTIGMPGLYTVTVTDAINGCTGTDQVNIGIDVTPPNAIIGTPQTLTCVVTQTTLQTTGSSTGNFYVYNWTTTGTGHFVSTQNPQSPIVDNPGVYNLLITNTNNGCTQTASVTVPENIVPPAAEAGPTVGLDCDTQTNTLNGNGSSTGANFTYVWTTQNGQIVSGNTTLTPTVGDPGTYVLLVTNTQTGCTQTDNVIVTENVVPPAFAIATPQVLTCALTSVPLNASGSNFGPSPSFSWVTNDGHIVSGGNTLTPTVNEPGVYSLTILNTVNGCSTTLPIAVTENTVPPNIQVQPAQLLTCSVLQFPLQSTVSSQTTISWSTANGHIVSGQNTPNPVVDQPGLYQAIVTSLVNGCTTTNQIPVDKETNLPTGVNFDLTHPLCNGTPGLLEITQVKGGIEPYAYSIDGGQNFFTFNEFGNLAAGNYTLLVQDANGCEIEQPIKVIPPLYPDVTLLPEFSIHLGEDQQLDAVIPPPFHQGLIEEVIWEPLDGLTFKSNSIEDMLHPTATPFRTTEYTLTIRTAEGCEAIARTRIKVDREVDIYVPNVIWPEDPDNDNATFTIFARDESIRTIHKLQIFDRWGTLMFENKDFEPNSRKNGWSGDFRGTPVNPAVFVWWAEVELIDGRVILLKGDVTVVR